ncbi:DUF2637 domain-containing protein [Streptomyces justiciae]|uniref:DUF2637 domain-containing protein n=1 Tax=Streptomyces justiciae TaxID=2780140 RepID=UPI00211982FB|nr:DUF2637 domain-containing protein [Streptomyces justiciae]MCW8383910.1 DUF2637 domain-containing protein [Streptomyces justiciae]
MDEATTASPEAEQEAPAPSRRGDRWTQLRDLRKSANTDRSAGEWLDLGLSTVTTAGTYALVGLGFSASYGTIRDIAQTKGGFSEGMSHVVPLSFEGGIIILSLHVIRQARQGERALLLRLIITLCSLATLLTNWSAAKTIEGQLTHVVPVAMFIICFEWLIHASRKKALKDMGLLPPPLAHLRAVEWLLDFPNAFARWRLMALHHIHNPDQAMWIRQTLALRKAELTQEQGAGKWRNVPKHVRLRMRADVLAEAERIFASDDADPGRYTTLVAHLSRPAIPAPRPEDAISTDRRELENPDEQTALPPGTQAATTGTEGDTPYVGADLDLDLRPEQLDDSGERPADRQMAHTAPTLRSHAAQAPQAASTMHIETSGERDERLMREQQEQDNHDRQTNEKYRLLLEVIHELTANSEPLTGPRIAEDPRVTVSPRSVQRHIKKMKEEGLLPEDLVIQ